jgi:hypothetical protein
MQAALVHEVITSLILLKRPLPVAAIKMVTALR